MNFALLFSLLVIYQVKHFLADYPLQRSYQLGKFKDGWDFFFPLLSHVAIHGAFTFLITNFFTQNLKLSTSLAVFDGTVHFFMDRIKAGKKYLGRFKPVTASEFIQAKKDFNIKWTNNCGEEYDKWTAAEKRLNSNTYFWWALGFDQMVHHLTHYICIYFILRNMGY